MNHIDPLPEWFLKKRLMVNDAFGIGKPVLWRQKSEMSAGKRYDLTITPWKISEGNPYYCEGKCVHVETGDTVAVVRRNYANLPSAWCILHPRTEENYLITSEELSGGITVFNLSQQHKIHTMTEGDHDGLGHSMICPYLNPSGSVLAVLGVVFGEIRSIRFYDFMDPDRPLKEISRFDGVFLRGTKKSPQKMGILVDVLDWEDEKNLHVVSEREIRRSDKAVLDTLPISEQTEAYETGDIGTRIDYYLLQTDGKYRLSETEFSKDA